MFYSIQIHWRKQKDATSAENTDLTKTLQKEPVPLDGLEHMNDKII